MNVFYQSVIKKITKLYLFDLEHKKEMKENGEWEFFDFSSNKILANTFFSKFFETKLTKDVQIFTES